MRIGVLSSQHEGAYFRVRLTATHPETHKVIEVYSHPLKIISKRNQVKKIIAKQQQQQAGASLSPVSSPVATPPSPVRTPSSTSSSNDQVAQALLRLEEQQREQAQLLQQLCSQVTSSPLKRAADDFDTALDKFLNAFRQIPAQERPAKLRKVLKNSPETTHTMMEFTELCNAEGYARSACGTECPHKKELENLDLLYSEFLTDPISSPPESLF